MTQSHTEFTIGAEGVDVEALVAGIRAEVERKTREGVYRDARIARAERHNLVHMKDSTELLTFYLTALRDTVHVDINDYTIQDKRTGWQGKALVRMKTIIWKLLKFYTYRLWSQQNQINGLLVTALECSQQNASKKIADLEKRVAELEARLDATAAHTPSP